MILYLDMMDILIQDKALVVNGAVAVLGVGRKL